MITTPKQGYRPDIDGLRAVAVLLVVFNHVGVRRFPGGYVGVDIFFVISGYLISSHLLRDIDAGTFSLARFYERRFRRIFPALLAALAATSVLSYLYLFPQELKSFAQTQLGALFSVSNIVLSHQTDYFNSLRKLAPLLHTWSLGVEEQFYIAFPILLFALCRWGRRHLRLFIWLLTLFGFSLACYWVGRDSTTAFYLAPLRAWEFLLGTLLAIGAVPRLNQSWQRNFAAATGLLLILAAGLRYREWTPFPGWHALAPCLGAALVLAAGETGTSITGELLSSKPARWIGLISYSLYLWHWPILVFQTTNSILVPDRYPTWAIKLAVIAVSLIVATLSWRLIEQPFRTGIFRSTRLGLYAINGSLFLLLLGFSAFILQHGGWLPASVPRSPAYAAFEKVTPSFNTVRWGTCYLEPQNFPALFTPSTCLADDPTRPHYLLLGDSHAASTYWGLKNTFPELNISQINVTGCAPVLHRPSYEDCNRVSDFIFNDYLQHHKIDTVLLVGRWGLWDADHLQQTIDWIKQHGIKVIVFGPSIEFDRSLTRLIEVSHHDHDPAAYARHRDHDPETTDQRMAALARDQWHVPYISMYQNLCGLPSQPGSGSASGCPIYAAPGVPLLWDTDHLSPQGSIFYAQTIRSRHQLP